MRDIELIYSKDKKESYQLPEFWHELNGKQLVGWAQLCLQKKDFLEAKIYFIQRFYPFSKTAQKWLRKHHFIEIVQRMTFLTQSPRMSCWLIPSFRLWFIRYEGPGDALSAMTIAEFRLAEICYTKYLKSHDKQFLIALAAILYRPKREQDFSSDRRKVLAKCSIDRQTKRFKRLSPALLQAILMNYEGCRSFIHLRYASLFKTNGHEASVQDFQDIIDAVAGDKLGTITQTEQTHIHRFFRHLMNMIKAKTELQPS